METSTLVFTAIFAAVIALIALIFWIVQTALKATVHKGMQGSHRNLAIEILSSAIDARAAFRVEIDSDELQDTTLKGVCTAIEKKFVLVDLYGSDAAKLRIGMSYTAYFAISYKKSTSFYLFKGHIVNVQKRGSNVLTYLSFPDQLIPEQKRAFVRHTPSTESIVGMVFWDLPPLHPLPQKKTDLDRPIFIYRKEAEAGNKILLDNISAGGLRVSLDEASREKYRVPLTIDEQLILLLILKSTAEETPPLAMWIVCHVRSLQHTPDEELWHIGMQFTKWAKATSGQEPINWLATNQDNCIPPLAAWVMTSHTEQHKML